MGGGWVGGRRSRAGFARTVDAEGAERYADSRLYLGVVKVRVPGEQGLRPSARPRLEGHCITFVHDGPQVTQRLSHVRTCLPASD